MSESADANREANSALAVGERQRLPVQMNRTVLISSLALAEAEGSQILRS